MTSSRAVIVLIPLILVLGMFAGCDQEPVEAQNHLVPVTAKVINDQSQGGRIKALEKDMDALRKRVLALEQSLKTVNLATAVLSDRDRATLTEARRQQLIAQNEKEIDEAHSELDHQFPTLATDPQLRREWHRRAGDRYDAQVKRGERGDIRKALLEAGRSLAFGERSGE